MLLDAADRQDAARISFEVRLDLHPVHIDDTHNRHPARPHFDRRYGAFTGMNAAPSGSPSRQLGILYATIFLAVGPGVAGANNKPS